MSNKTPFNPSSHPSAILVVRLGAIGDVVRTLPAVRLLRETWPQARLAWVVEPAAAPLLTGHPALDRVVVLPRRDLAAAARRFAPGTVGILWRFIRELRGLNLDLALDYQGSLKSGLVSRLAGARVRIGFDRHNSRELSHLFANVRVPLESGRIHRVERAVRLSRAAGAADFELKTCLGLSEEETLLGARRLREITGRRPVVALAPFSSRRQSWKRYPLGGWADVAAILAREGIGVVVLGGPGESDEMQQICETAGDGVAPCGDLDIRGLAGLVGACDLFVGGDTGPMHIAWAVGRPVVAVYGPTDPIINAPFGPGHVTLAPAGISRRNDPDRFPGIDPETIASAVRRKLAGKTGPSKEITR